MGETEGHPGEAGPVPCRRRRGCVRVARGPVADWHRHAKPMLSVFTVRNIAQSFHRWQSATQHEETPLVRSDQRSTRTQALGARWALPCASWRGIAPALAPQRSVGTGRIQRDRVASTPRRPPHG